MNKFIIDGLNLAFRAHFAFNSLRTSTGLMSGSVYGFLKILKSLKNKYPTCEFIVTWDSYAKRKKNLYPEYKANRNHINIGTNIIDLKSILLCLNIVQAEAEGEEGDDVIATICQNVDGIAFIYSSDKDLLQLVKDGKVVVIRPKVGTFPERVYDEEAVLKEYGVRPGDFSCYQSLRGDSVDNIPGVARLPSKVIASLSNKYHSPASIYNNINYEILTDFQRRSVAAAEKQVAVNYELVTLNRNLNCLYTAGTSNPAGFKGILEKYEITSIPSDSYVDIFDKDTAFSNRTGDPVLKTYNLFEEE